MSYKRGLVLILLLIMPALSTYAVNVVRVVHMNIEGQPEVTTLAGLPVEADEVSESLAVIESVASETVSGSAQIAVSEPTSNAKLQSQIQSTTPFRLSDFRVGPNPYNPDNGVLVIQYELTRQAFVRLFMYSISGERLWAHQVSAGDINGGAVGVNQLTWDGDNRFGERVANGPYILYVMASAEGETKTAKTKVLVLR